MDQQRRKFLSQMAVVSAAAGLGACASPVNLVQPSSKKRFYMDGLSFLPERVLDVTASELNAFIADISSIEEVINPDGSVNYKRTYKACMKSIKSSLKTVQQNADIYKLIESANDLNSLDDRCGVLFQIQGADCVEPGIDRVDEFYQLGLRALQMTHHYDNAFAGGAISNTNRGLNKEGIKLVEKLESKSMLIDISHSSDQTALDTLKYAKGPVIQSHGAARAIVANARCSSDDVIKGIADSGGVFGVFMMSWWLTDEQVPLPQHYINHIKHVANIAGVEAVAIANDYPLSGQQKAVTTGNNNAIAIQDYKGWWEKQGSRGVLGFDKDVSHVVIPELNHIKRMRTLERILLTSGFKEREVDLIMGENWRRVVTDVLA